MNEIELMREKITQKFPAVRTNLDALTKAYCFLDAALNIGSPTRIHVIVVWRQGQAEPFGVSECSKPGAADKTFKDVDDAFAEVVRLLSR